MSDIDNKMNIAKKSGVKPSLNKIIVFDLETTGLPGLGEIIEIGAIKYNKSGSKYKVVNMFSERIKPLSDFWSEAAAQTHKIKREKLLKCRTIDQVLPEFLSFLENDYIIVGHRLGFDCTFIRIFTEKLGLEVPKNIVLDTYKIAINVLNLDKKLAKKHLKSHYDLHLKDLVKFYNVSYTLGDNHRAYVDARVTGEIF